MVSSVLLCSDRGNDVTCADNLRRERRSLEKDYYGGGGGGGWADGLKGVAKMFS